MIEKQNPCQKSKGSFQARDVNRWNKMSAAVHPASVPEQNRGQAPIFDEEIVTVWFWVYFAATLSVMGVIGVIIIWQLMKKAWRDKR